MAEDDRTSEREANIRTVLGRIGLVLRESGGGYQVVDAGTLKAVAGAQSPGGYSMSLKDAEDFTFMAAWAHGKPGREEQLSQAIEMAGWNPNSPHAGLPEGAGFVLADSPPRESQWRYGSVETWGPRAKNVLNTPTLRAGLLEKCEHLSGDEDFSFWVSTQPSMLLCGSCYEAAQRADERRCAFCLEPVEVPRDLEAATKATDKLGVHFYLCSHCVDLDRAAGGSP
jgi:hypothetical protein